VTKRERERETVCVCVCVRRERSESGKWRRIKEKLRNLKSSNFQPFIQSISSAAQHPTLAILGKTPKRAQTDQNSVRVLFFQRLFPSLSLSLSPHTHCIHCVLVLFSLSPLRTHSSTCSAAVITVVLFLATCVAPMLHSSLSLPLSPSLSYA
jgi:hypothetical protein